MIDLSRISPKSWLGKLLRLPLRLVPKDAVVPVLQGRLRSKRWIAGSGLYGHWLGTYELAKRRIFEKTVRNGGIVYDVGAHTGFYTLLASVLVRNRGHVFAFEPLPQNLFYLREHLRLNDVGNVTVIEAAVMDRAGDVAFDPGTENTFTGRISTTGDTLVKAVALDRLVQEGELPLPDYIKIDVEGAERQVLLGVRHVLKDAHPTLFLATHGKEIHRECCGLLWELGYQLQSLDGKPLENSRELMAVYTNDSTPNRMQPQFRDNQ